MTTWTNCSTDVTSFVNGLVSSIQRITGGNFVGVYLHGSLAMGGFNPHSSDIDILVVTRRSLTLEDKRELAKLLLQLSGHPHPIEISILTEQQLSNWNHPSPYEFHYSEMWRAKYEVDLEHGSQEFLDHQHKRDGDLSAHLTVTKERGFCLIGKPISETFPSIPRQQYLGSILGDFQDCLHSIFRTPVYSVLNLIRVYLYAKEGVVSSKKEAGEWALFNLPDEFKSTVQKVIMEYSNPTSGVEFSTMELSLLRNYIEEQTSKFLSNSRADASY